MYKNINLFVEKLGNLGNTDQGIDMAKWFIYLGFDILGEMAFGDSFGCVERGELIYILQRRQKLTRRCRSLASLA
jgi:hypothetical protein